MYATPADFIVRIGEREAIELTDVEGQGEVNEKVLSVALDDASSQIDGYLGRYRLPLDTVPKNLTRLCCDMARYHLTSKSGRTTTEEVENRYKFCLKELENIAKGVISLGVDERSGATEESDGDDIVQMFNVGKRIWGKARQ